MSLQATRSRRNRRTFGIIAALVVVSSALSVGFAMSASAETLDAGTAESVFAPSRVASLLAVAGNSSLHTEPIGASARKCATSKKKLKNKKKYKRCNTQQCTTSKKKLKNKKKYKRCKRKCTTSDKKLKNKKKFKRCNKTAPSTPEIAFPVGVPVVCAPYNKGSLDEGVSLYAFRGGTLELFATLTQGMIAGSAWRKFDIDVDCLDRLQWSTDFSKFIFEARPADSDFHHIGLFDLRARTVIDLTKLRQGTGFSDPILDEKSPRFLGGGGRVSFGAEQVLFVRANDDQRFVTSISNPTLAQPVAEPMSTNAYNGHPELVAGYWVDPSVKNGPPIANPDGTLISNFSGNPEGVAPAATGTVSTALNCPLETPQAAVGWRDANHLITFQGTLGPGDIRHLSVATINSDGTLAACRPLIPPNDREILGTQLSFDGTKLYFTATDPAGYKNFSVSTLGDATSEPVLDSNPWFPTDGKIAYPVL